MGSMEEKEKPVEYNAMDAKYRRMTPKEREEFERGTVASFNGYK